MEARDITKAEAEEIAVEILAELDEDMAAADLADRILGDE